MIFGKIFIIFALGCLSAITAQFIYLNNGVFKFISGIGLPIDVEMSGGSVSWFSNVQVFYKVPDNITYFKPYKSVQKKSLKRTFNRPNLYEAFVKYFERLGFSGSDCIYRTICEVASRRVNEEENGLMGEVVEILFSPGRDAQEGLEKHKAAQWMGLYNGSSCEEVYRDCYLKEGAVFFS